METDARQFPEVEKALAESATNIALARAKVAGYRGETITPRARGELERALGHERQALKALLVKHAAIDAAFTTAEVEGRVVDMPVFEGLGPVLQAMSDTETSVRELETH